MVGLQRADHHGVNLILTHYVYQVGVLRVHPHTQQTLTHKITVGAYESLEGEFLDVLVEYTLGQADTALKHTVNEYVGGAGIGPGQFKHELYGYADHEHGQRYANHHNELTVEVWQSHRRHTQVAQTLAHAVRYYGCR